MSIYIAYGWSENLGQKCDFCLANDVSALNRHHCRFNPSAKRHWNSRKDHSEEYGFIEHDDGTAEYLYTYCAECAKGVAPDEMLMLIAMRDL